MIKDLDKMLINVQKPSRYTGAELNMIKKDTNDVRIRFAMCFPDVYEVGMSHLGLRILYHVINKIDWAYCERAFMPWTDFESELIKADTPLFALETKDSLGCFDFIGFTLQYELSYTNVLAMLTLSKIPIKSKDRNDEHPLVIAGGPCSYNPAPLAEFVDLFMIGEAEEAIIEILELYDKHKSSGKSRRDFLSIVKNIQGVYVPSQGQATVRKRFIKDLDKVEYPTDTILPYTQIIHDRAVLELFRGCIRGCRFCQAGYVYRPVREKSVDTLAKQAEEIIASTGYEEISLASLSTSDYSDLGKLGDKLDELVKKKRVNLSLPSLRVDSFSLGLLKRTQNDRRSGLTFAPEAGTDRLRTVINKGITETDILNSVKLAFSAGYRTIKLYFMLGLPTETIDDVLGIAALVRSIADEYKQITGKINGLNINVSTAYFVPKAFTPFQWEQMLSSDEYLKRIDLLRSKLDRRYTSYSWHDHKTGLLEALFARGGQTAGRVLLRAFEKGCRFDAWKETFDYNKWLEACSEEGVDLEQTATGAIDTNTPLPWDIIDIGVTKAFLLKERNRAYEGESTVNCKDGCASCGLLIEKTGVCAKW